jgi:hypothetical protein
VIATHARVLVVEALSLRLRLVERALGSSTRPAGPSMPLADPEEGLRELMVQHLPRVSAMNADRRARVCGLLADGGRCPATWSRRVEHSSSA